MTDEPNAKADIETVRQSYQHLLSQSESLILATTNPDGTPRASYAPFIVNEQRQFYIFTSQLSAHTANLQHTGQASVMLLEDEAAATQIFARKRGYRVDIAGEISDMPIEYRNFLRIEKGL